LLAVKELDDTEATPPHKFKELALSDTPPMAANEPTPSIPPVKFTAERLITDKFDPTETDASFPVTFTVPDRTSSPTCMSFPTRKELEPADPQETFMDAPSTTSKSDPVDMEVFPPNTFNPPPFIDTEETAIREPDPSCPPFTPK
jgi:hypothetical protein